MKVSEVYRSVQGEGPRVGTPTIFVRFAGCNLRCPEWPCDTPHAIDPALYRHEWKEVDPEGLTDVIMATGSINCNVCLTGGEPFLQPKEELKSLVECLTEEGYPVIECFSNGTLPYPEWALQHIYFVVDWKLSGSGERNDDLVRAKNCMWLDGVDSIKFTVKNETDFEEAFDIWQQLMKRYLNSARKAQDIPEFFCGPVWGALEPSQLVEWMAQRDVPWRLNLQTHNYIWDREQRGI